MSIALEKRVAALETALGRTSEQLEAAIDRLDKLLEAVPMQPAPKRGPGRPRKYPRLENLNGE